MHIYKEILCIFKNIFSIVKDARLIAWVTEVLYSQNI